MLSGRREELDLAAVTDEFWKLEGLSHITPGGQENPEGWDVWTYLSGLARGSVVEIGCGMGRLCRAFPPTRYLGTDINPAALERARETYPAYSFAPYVGQRGDTALLYTVLLHIDDDAMPAFVSGVQAERVIVAEIMGRHWRREGALPAFNREADEYVAAFDAYGFACVSREEKPYMYYEGTSITFLVFDR